MAEGRAPKALVAVAIVGIGIVLGLGVSTFVYARGWSYLVDDPAACVNCHVMRANYDAWSRSSHQAVSCDSCHVPRGIGAWGAKLRNGFFHSVAFTFGNFREPIRIRPANAEVLDRNCVECHRTRVGLIRPEDRRCAACHAFVSH